MEERCTFPACPCNGICDLFEAVELMELREEAAEFIASIYEHALAEAREELEAGVKEEGGENRGPRVKEYLAEAGIKVPAPWCAAYVNWCAKEAAAKLKITSPLEEVPSEALVQSYFQYFNKRKRIVAAADVQPGYLFVLWYANLGRYGHIGFVKSIDIKAGTFETYEGNTNDQLSREGDAVLSKSRRITPNVKFIRWAD